MFDYPVTEKIWFISTGTIDLSKRRSVDAGSSTYGEIPARGATRAEFLVMRGMARPLVDRRRWEGPARRKVRGPTIRDPYRAGRRGAAATDGPRSRGRARRELSRVEEIASRCAVHPPPLFTVDERNRRPRPP